MAWSPREWVRKTLTDRPCQWTIVHKYPLGVWCWTHEKYQHDH